MADDDLIFIGDVHGQYYKLADLLAQMEVFHVDVQRAGMAPKLVFVGDLIDNRLQARIDHRRTLDLVRSLCDSEQAYCLMGNHEFNAVGWLLRHPTTCQPLRPHSVKNRLQHQTFLDEVGEDSEAHRQWVAWFMSLPLFLDFGAVRAIHACWDDEVIARLRPYLNADNSLKAEHWPDAFDPAHELWSLCETLLKGPELALPNGYSFKDKHGMSRRHIRSRWWMPDARTYRDIAQVPADVTEQLPSLPLPGGHQPRAISVPVVVGHYTLDGLPVVLSENVVCVDYNAAHPERPLVCYHWRSRDGETLDSARFVLAPQKQLAREVDRAAMRVLEHYAACLSDYDLDNSQAVISEVSRFLLCRWDPLGVKFTAEGASHYRHYVMPAYKLALHGELGTLALLLWQAETTLMGFYTADHEEMALCKVQSLMLAQQLIAEVATLSRWRTAQTLSA